MLCGLRYIQAKAFQSNHSFLLSTANDLDIPAQNNGSLHCIFTFSPASNIWQFCLLSKNPQNLSFCCDVRHILKLHTFCGGKLIFKQRFFCEEEKVGSPIPKKLNFKTERAVYMLSIIVFVMCIVSTNLLSGNNHFVNRYPLNAFIRL